MDRKKLILYFQSALCVLWVVLMAAAAIHIYRDGLAYQAQGHPDAWIFTREKVTAAFGRYLPVLLLAVLTNIVGVVIGVRDENQDKPVADPDTIALYKKERENGRDPVKEAAQKQRLRIARIAVLIVAVIFVIAGIINGSMEDMLIRAVNICTECIGLG